MNVLKLQAVQSYAPHKRSNEQVGTFGLDDERANVWADLLRCAGNVACSGHSGCHRNAEGAPTACYTPQQLVSVVYLSNRSAIGEVIGLASQENEAALTQGEVDNKSLGILKLPAATINATRSYLTEASNG